MNINVCIGSSCHLKGSYNVIKAFEELIEKNDLGKEVELSAAFCLGHCQTGVTIRIDEEIVTGLTPDNASDIFQKYVLDKR